MNPLAPYMAFIKAGAVALILLAAFSAGAVWNGNRWEAKYQKLESEYNQFKGGVAALGEAAKVENAKIALADLKAKERADEENKRQHTADIDTILRLRRAADSARGSFVPPAPAGTKCPDGQACFDGPELERALRGLVEEVRGLVDEGTSVATDLNTAKRWAQKLTETLGAQDAR